MPLSILSVHLSTKSLISSPHMMGKSWVVSCYVSDLGNSLGSLPPVGAIILGCENLGDY